jgi:hypothetical protein
MQEDKMYKNKIANSLIVITCVSVMALLLLFLPEPAKAVSMDSCQAVPGQVVINEILPAPVSNGIKWLELYNATGGPIPIGYCYNDDTMGGGPVPIVLSIRRADPNPTNAENVNFTVTFSEAVTGVDTSPPFYDFGMLIASLQGPSITGVSGSGTTYTVTVNTGPGSGSIQLVLIDNDSIQDASGVPLGGPGWGNGNYPNGEAYTVGDYIFFDVPDTYWAWSFIERLYTAGITGGCSVNLLNYCPEGVVTRAQMAVFLLRGIHTSSYTPPPIGADSGFGDVPVDYWSGAWIKQLAAEGITAGCGNGNYCPEQPVTRAQMAVFLLRSKYGAGYIPPDVGAGTGFGDVVPDYWAAAWIKQLILEGITSGCGNGNYCPENPVTRAQMAVFLVRTFHLP